LEKRLETAKKLGGTAINANEKDAVSTIMELTGGKGARVVIDCAGTESTIADTARVAKAGGTVVLVGLASSTINGLSRGLINSKELIITSIFRYRNLYPLTIDAISSGKIDIKGIVSNEYKLEDTARAYTESTENIKDVVKSVILFD
jgi:L-iditol 2-dehydrogenase